MTTCLCETCGADIHIGDFPFCPHGRASVNVHGDDVPGGFTVENGFSKPRTFYSKSAHQKALAAEGCEMRPYWHPGDRHLTRWDTVDLTAAATLLTRGPQRVREKHAAADAVITVRDGEPLRLSDL
jgi:hypothetical protein